VISVFVSSILVVATKFLRAGSALLQRQVGSAPRPDLSNVAKALASAEASYALALARVSEIDMRGDADGASLTAALRAFATLPAAVGAQHDHVRGSGSGSGLGHHHVSRAPCRTRSHADSRPGLWLGAGISLPAPRPASLLQPTTRLSLISPYAMPVPRPIWVIWVIWVICMHGISLYESRHGAPCTMQVQEGLADITRTMQLVVTHYRAECAAVAQACGRSLTSLDNARRQLHVAFLVHQEACRWVGPLNPSKNQN